jgi:DNA-binding NtrC family response regulator
MVRRSQNPLRYRILSVSSDISRLSSGANILTQAGYTADLVVTIDQAVRRALVRQYHLVVVSSTFSRDEQIAIGAKLKQVRHNLPVLLLGPEHNSPDIFLAAVASALRQKTKFQFGTKLDGAHLDPRIK